MRVKLNFEEPLPPYKCWYEVPATCSNIKDLQRSIRKGFNLDKVCKTTRLDLDGFFLLPASSIAGSLNDGDLLQVMIRRKSDVLPPRSLPAAGGQKRERDEKEVGLDQERSKRQRTRKRPQSQNQKPMNSTTPNKHTGKGAAPGNQQPRKNNAQPLSKNSQQPSRNSTANPGNQQQKLSQNKVGGQKNGKAPQGRQPLKKPDMPPSTKKVEIRPTSNGQKKQGKMLDQPKNHTTVPSSSSDSSSDSDSDSDSSDSESDSDGSDSDSSDSGDSDSSDSSSGSERSSEDMADSVPNRTVSPPGAGNASTKGRNARRNARLKESRKKKLAELKAAVSSSASVVERAASSLAENSPIKPAPAKVFMTTVKLQDQNPTSRKQNTTRNAATKTQQPTAPTPTPPHQTSTAAGVESHAVEVSSSKTKATRYEEEEEHEGSSGPRDYESLPKHTGETRVGEVIAFKTLEIGADYSPIISEFKEAKVLKWSEVEKEAEVQLARKFREPLELDDEGRPVLGKFEVYDEDQFEMARRGIVVLDMLSLFDCRVVS